MRIILASASPRRIELLKRILKDKEFIVEPSHIDERKIDVDDCSLLVLLEAREKALDISSKERGALVISSDTMVLFDGKKLGKPSDEEEAFSTLRMLSGKEHEILSSFCVMKDSKILKEGTTSSKLFIHPMTDQEILDYVRTGKPLDKAGSYGIQDTDYIKSDILSGTMESIMGLPVEELRIALSELGII